jgi:type I restriction enzyme, S subunit
MTAGSLHTEAGKIPANWSRKQVRELGAVVTGGTPSTHISEYWNGDIPWITPTDISNQRDLYESERMISDAGLRAIRALPPNTVLVTCIASIGKNAVLRTVGASNQQINAVIPNESNNVDFLFYLFESAKTYLAASAGTTATSIVSKATFQNLEFTIPPLPEQRAIAEALSDVDALLSGLDRLIAKKRDLKQAAMQQLLTGQTRLPGFHGEWEVTTFAQTVRHHSGNSTLIKGKLSAEPAVGLYPGYSASGQDVWCDHFDHEGDAVIVSAVGSRCGKAFMAAGRWCAIANTHVIWPIPSKIDLQFLGFFINDESFWLKSGSGQPFVLFKQTLAKTLRLPPVPEQTAIAQVLSDMDAELAALETRREKTRQLKQGMMQELLTGRTRLV